MANLRKPCPSNVAVPPASASRLWVRTLGAHRYESVWRAMQRFTRRRGPHADDELWIVEHPAVFTLGQAGRCEHLIAPGNIPVVHCDRGGQVTYHGPGQAVVYALLDLRRSGLGVRHLVNGLEQCVIDILAGEGVAAERRAGAPGVYVDATKVAALGLRVKNGCCYHGIAVNVHMDLEPFDRIDPCGARDLDVTQTSDLGIDWSVGEAAKRFAQAFAARFDYRSRCTPTWPQELCPNKVMGIGY